MNGNSYIISQSLTQEPVIFAKRIEVVALQVKHSGHYLVKDQGNGHLGACVLGWERRGAVARFLRHVVYQHGLAIAGYPGNYSFIIIQVEHGTLERTAALSAAGFVNDLASDGMNRIQVDIRKIQMLLDKDCNSIK